MQSLIGNSIGQYRVTHLLAVGGMGEVYRAEERHTGRTVALKVLRNLAQDPSFLQRFHNECRIQAKLYHPNIAALLEVCETSQGPCILMEYVPGITLAELIRRDGAIAWPVAARWFHGIARGVGYLHANQIVHRDITLSNVKVTPSGGIKLLDFGLARDARSMAMTQIGTVAGTTDYLSPEQITGRAADARSDVWSLGVLFHAMLTGELPFQAADAVQLLEQLKRRTYAGLRAFDPSLPGSCDALISRCLRLRPARRFQNAGEITARLEAILSSSASCRAASSGGVGAVIRWVSRHRISHAVVASSGILFAVLLLTVLPNVAVPPTGYVPETLREDPSPVSPTPDFTQPLSVRGVPQPTAGSCGLGQTVAASLAEVRISSVGAPFTIHCGGQILGRATSEPLIFMAEVGSTLPLILSRESGREQHVSLTVAELNNEYSY